MIFNNDLLNLLFLLFLFNLFYHYKTDAISIEQFENKFKIDNTPYSDIHKIPKLTIDVPTKTISSIIDDIPTKMDNIPALMYPLNASDPASYIDEFPLNQINKKMLKVISNELYYITTLKN